MLSKTYVCSKVVAVDLFLKMSKDCHSAVVILRRVILDSNILAISTYVLLSIFKTHFRETPDLFWPKTKMRVFPVHGAHHFLLCAFFILLIAIQMKH